MKQMNLYRCKVCQFDFGISVEYEDQSTIKCPCCLSAEHLLDYEQYINYQTMKVAPSESITNVFQLIEKEFARPLSSMEYDMINAWFYEGHTQELIIAALREAIVAGVKKLRYIDRILYNWKDNGIRTVQEAKKHSESFRNYQAKKGNYQAEPRQRKAAEGFPAYNWLES